MSDHNYVRFNRKKWALSQEELGELLGISQGFVSRIEMGTMKPDLTVALALQAIFGRSPRALFPNLYRPVEDAVMRAAAKLDRRIRARDDHASLRKVDLLRAMAERAAPRDA